MPDSSSHPRRWRCLTGPMWLVLLCVSLPAASQVQVSLPLEGYYRPGRYIPARITANFDQAPGFSSLYLAADNALGLRLDIRSGRGDAIVPWLLESEPTALRWNWMKQKGTIPNLAFRPLRPGQRLIAFAGADPAIAQDLFPGQSIIPIHLDPARPLPGPAIAWEALDAVILDAPAAQRLSEEQLATLLANGTAFAVRADSPPHPRWPWQKHIGGWWLLRHTPAGPTDLAFNEQAYRPVLSWQSQWPPAFRFRLLMYAVIFCILALGVALLHWRWAAGLMLLLSVTSLFLLDFWWGGQSPMLQRDGQVVIIGAHLAQSDSWTYVTSAVGTNESLPWRGPIHPVFATPAQMQAAAMTLACQPNGQPDSLLFKLPPDLKLAFLTRSVGPQPPLVQPDPRITSPLEDLARHLYLQPGDRIVGQLPVAAIPRPAYAPADLWPAIVIDRRPPADPG